MKKQNQVNFNLSDEQEELLAKWVTRFGKSSKGQIFKEMLELYGQLYEAAEEAKLDVVQKQLGKATASVSAAPPKQRRA